MFLQCSNVFSTSFSSGFSVFTCRNMISKRVCTCILALLTFFVSLFIALQANARDSYVVLLDIGNARARPHDITDACWEGWLRAAQPNPMREKKTNNPHRCRVLAFLLRAKRKSGNLRLKREPGFRSCMVCANA